MMLLHNHLVAVNVFGDRIWFSGVTELLLQEYIPRYSN